MPTSPFHLSNDNSTGTIIASKIFFESDAVLSALSKYTSHYYITVVPTNESDIKITVQNKTELPLSIEILKEVMNEFIDQQIRIDLQKKFGNLRDIIVKHAFEPVRM